MSLWNVQTGEYERKLIQKDPVPGINKAHGTSITSLAFSQDGRRLVSGDKNGFGKLWNLEEWREEQDLYQIADVPITSLGISDDYQSVVAGLKNGKAILIISHVLPLDEKILLIDQSSDLNRTVNQAHRGEVWRISIASDQFTTQDILGDRSNWDISDGKFKNRGFIPNAHV